ncbi:Low molecular weight protein-tyrosine-phosphatase etp [Corynebacterium occultum]|uniref:Low molecular weight protein-tyrosine-phosphatase etp n=1 Tax=Corynebacterium occultum TaxID=2675219 RepID=A0A6B8W7J2_9CORY|nr:low molecular weight phosphatase family protein [Corynebacterium occultum]QGU07265.1 Low molecular weight protein-tyrosine-phosphatase etp [Corynebacterium occultum]
MSSNFHILMVCTGNICRSPLAQQLLSQRVANFPEITVSSAGTHALEDHPTPAYGRDIARKMGVEQPELHRGRSLTSEMLAEADLILTMSREQRRIVAQLNPQVVKRVFTLREFARLAEKALEGGLAIEIAGCDEQPLERLRAAIQAVTYARGESLPPDNIAHDEVTDPYRRSYEAYHRSAQQILSAVDATAILLGCALVGLITIPSQSVDTAGKNTPQWQPVALMLILSAMAQGLLYATSK